MPFCGRPFKAWRPAREPALYDRHDDGYGWFVGGLLAMGVYLALMVARRRELATPKGIPRSCSLARRGMSGSARRIRLTG